MHHPFRADTQIVALVQNLPDAVIAVDSTWQIVALNERAASFVQQTSAQVSGKTLWDVVPEVLGVACEQRYRDALQTQTAVRFEVWYPALARWFQITASPVQHGLLLFFQKLPRDRDELASRWHLESPAEFVDDATGVVTSPISGEKQAEEALRTSERLKQAILDSLTSNIAVLDPTGTIIAVNEAWRHFSRNNSKSGLPAKKTGVGVNYLEVCKKAMETCAEGAQEALAGLQAVLQGSEAHFTMEYPCHSPTERRWFLMNATPLHTGEGAVVVHLDITERKRAEEAVRASEVRTRRLLEASLISVVVADAEHILEANDTFLEMVGYTREDLVNHRLNWSAMTPIEYAPFDQRGLQELYERGVCTPFEKEFYRKDGSRVPILIGASTLQEQPVQWACFILDISERKERERRKDEFISMASHELKTPITSLKGFVHLVQRRLEQQGTSELTHYLERIQTQLNTLTKLVNDLLDVSKIQAGGLDYAQERVDLDALVYEVVEFLQQTTTTHTIRLSGASHAFVLGDRDRLGQVFTNLLTNAIKYSPQAKEVDVQIAPSAQSVTVSVRDYGVGIAHSYQSKIFERFYRVQNNCDKAFPGLGMGLYISQEIVKRHGGTLRVVSEKGQGATFSVTLPLPG